MGANEFHIGILVALPTLMLFGQFLAAVVVNRSPLLLALAGLRPAPRVSVAPTGGVAKREKSHREMQSR